MRNTYLKLARPTELLTEEHRLIAFQGYSEWGGLYEFSLELIVSKKSDFDHLLMQEIQWSCHGDGFLEISGIIKSIHVTELEDESQKLIVSVSSPLLFLKGTRKFRVFRQLSLVELLKQVFSEYPSLNCQFDVDFDSYRESWIQYDESDYEFIRRVLAEFCSIFCIDHNLLIQIKKISNYSMASSLNLDCVHDFKRVSSNDSKKISFLSNQIFYAGDLFKYEHETYQIVKLEYLTFGNETKTLNYKLNKYVCCIQASLATPLQSYFSCSLGFCNAKLLGPKQLNGHSIKANLRFSWDKTNLISSSAECAQLWSGHQQGLQFIPDSSARVILHPLEGSLDNLIIIGCLNQKFETKQEIKVAFNSLNLLGNFSISTEHNENRELGSNYIEDIKRNLDWDAYDEWMMRLEKGAYHLQAKNINFKLGSSLLELGESSIKFSAASIELQTPHGVGKGLARAGDQHTCPLINPDLSPHLGGVILEGSRKLSINNLAATRKRDSAICLGSSDVISEGVSDLLIEAQEAAFLGSGCFHGGTVASSSTNVISTRIESSSSQGIKGIPSSFPEYWAHMLEV